jgi:hypothetical protein
MSAWVVGLGLAAGYLINKNVAIVSRLDESVTEFNSAAKPATGGVTSAEVRNAWKRTDHVKYADMNTGLPKKQMDALAKNEERAASEVEQFEQGSPAPILGVMLHYDRLGV